MSDRHHTTETGELVYAPRPSWAPAVFAFSAALAVCGVFAEGFMVRGWVYSIIGGIVVLAALRKMATDATRDHRRLPPRQRARSAVLPVETITPPQA